ncbi:12152_t:CDS:1, partial [Acaulospora morrowiae]
PLSYVNDMITAQRRADLDVYVKELLNLPTYILEDPLLNQLFGMREGDVETPTDPRQPEISPILDASPVDPSLNSTNSFQPQHVKQQSSLSGTYKHSNNPSLSGQSFKSSHVHDESSGHSSVTSPMNAPNTSSTIPSSIKVKILYKEDLIAIRIASNISYAQLREKLYERLGGH